MSRQPYPTQLRDELGNDVHLPPKPFAVGGEGAVFDVLGKPDLVAKLYSKPQSKERCDKLRAMARLCNPDLVKIAAWPSATLSKGRSSAVDGILMRKVVDHKEIHHLYSVAQRKKDFPEVDWGFLLHTARNCAIAFESVHRHGHVVGDVNQKNVMVSKKGIVTLVDCDSFQVAEGQRLFRCNVGVPEYTPPELHGKNFGTLDRSANHDLFGLAVLVFHLLMMGRHPFSGVPLVSADIAIEKAIQDGLYAYTKSPTKLKPPPNVPPVTMLDQAILVLFERAFRSPQRPTASEWRAALDSAMKQLQRCRNDPKHSYQAAAGKCPWCHLIATARLMFFLPSHGAAGPLFRPEDIDQLIRKLAAMQITFTVYARPRPVPPIQVALSPGLHSLQAPTLLPHPSPPGSVPMPVLTPLPPPPMLPIRPPLQSLPTAPRLLPNPSLAPHPASRPQPKPLLEPYPPGPKAPPRPKFQTLPPRPAYPSSPTLGSPDPFLSILCIYGFFAGLVVMLFARPVGVILMIAFAVWWVILTATEGKRRESARNSLKAAHKYECECMDVEYAEICRPIKDANKRLSEAWQAKRSAIAAEYPTICRGIDEENQRRLAAWEEIDAFRRTEHDRECAMIDVANRAVLAEWRSKNSAITAEHQRASNEIDQANRRVLATWEAEDNSRLSGRTYSFLRF